MTDAGAPFREAPQAPRFVCVSCMRCTSLAEEPCASCGQPLRPLSDEIVVKAVMDAARKVVTQKAKTQIFFALPFAAALAWYMFHLGYGPQPYLLPGILFAILIIVQPYLFRDRIGRKYRGDVTTIEQAFDILGTRPQ